MFSIAIHHRQQRRRITWIMLIVLLPLFAVPWSQGASGAVLTPDARV